MGLVRRVAAANTVEVTREYSRDAAGLRDQLRHGDAEQRRRAALDLWGDEDALQELLEARARETDPIVANAILTTLTGQDCAAVGRALRPDLSSDDAALRNAAVRALQDLPIATETLIADGILTDPDVDVRILAVMVLSAVVHPAVPQWLRPVVESDNDANVVAAVVDLAITIGSELAAEFSATAVSRFPDNPYVLFLAHQADTS